MNTLKKTEEKLNYSFLTDKEDHIDINESQIDYDGLIYLDKKDFSMSANKDFVDKPENEEVSFYCKACKKITDIKDIAEIEAENVQKNKQPKNKFKPKNKNKNKTHLVCEICNKEEIIIGTTRGINEHFHLK
ncbi:TPA: hypothetical protein EYG84_02140 [Candidatus Gracilibacteria bacterium]|nr:hypothetical protein [Candidatus Gracilibacteria bacterium]